MYQSGPDIAQITSRASEVERLGLSRPLLTNVCGTELTALSRLASIS